MRTADLSASSNAIKSHKLPLLSVQANRQLARLGLPAPLAERLAARNLRTASDLFTRTPLDLAELLDLDYDTVHFILREAAAKVTPPPQTVGGCVVMWVRAGK